MKNMIYPAVFRKEDDGIYTVTFPDLEGCITYGYTLEEAFNMAGDALYAWLDAFDDAPAASELEEIETKDGEFVQLIKAAIFDETREVLRKKIVEEIERGLKKKGYTKNQAAQILGVDRSYITKIAKGDSTPAPEMAKRIGLLLGFDWKIFFADGVTAM